MTAEDTSQMPRPGSNADIIRRVERLEDTTASLGKAVDQVNHRLDLVNLTQQHQTEMMNTKFTGLETLLHATSAEVTKITSLIQAAMAGDPSVQSPMAQQMIAEYREFQQTVLGHIKDQNDKNEAVDDYILVQKTRSETTGSIAKRAFGSSVLGAIGGGIGIVLGVLALLQSHPH